MKEKKLFVGELALFMGLIINSFANTLMVKSGFGISSISSVPYTLSLVFDNITYGSWNYIFQCVLILILVLITKKFKVGYIVSFFLAIVFGNMIDFCNIFIMQKLPNNIIYNIFPYKFFNAFSWNVIIIKMQNSSFANRYFYKRLN